MKHEPSPTEAEPLPDYIPIALRPRHDGWTAERQRKFLLTLAESGSITEACHQAGITARSAYRLRHHPDGAQFAEAWDKALRAAAGRLVSLAFERAVRGSYRELWRDGRLVAQSRQPSDKLLMFLIDRHAPFNHGDGTRWARLHAMSAEAGRALGPLVETLADSDLPADRLAASDYAAAAPLTGHDARIVPFDEDEYEPDYGYDEADKA